MPYWRLFNLKTINELSLVAHNGGTDLQRIFDSIPYRGLVLRIKGVEHITLYRILNLDNSFFLDTFISRGCTVLYDS
jgi:hypothetical protein